MAFSTTRVPRRRHRDSYTEWILVALVVLAVVLTFCVAIIYVAIIR